VAPIFHLNYRQDNGFVISAAITRYVYITINEVFRCRIIAQDSKFEEADCVEDQHPIIGEALKLTEVASPYLEIVSLSDIPAGTGRDPRAASPLHTLKRDFLLPHDLAGQAGHIELKLPNEPIGKQDQYIAAIGGVTCFHFLPDDRAS
jgi:D-glycero-alpha-D-manno-heptose-7-phosphate kinase